MSNENIENEYRYHVVTSKSDDELMGIFNDLEFLIERFWYYFATFPNEFVVIDTKYNSRFTIKVKN